MENADSETQEEAPTSDENPAQTRDQDQDQENMEMAQDEKEKEDEDEVMDCDSSAASPVSNRFSVLSEQQQTKEVEDDGADQSRSEADQEGEEDEQLASELEKVNLDDAFTESNSEVEENQMGMDSEDEPPEAKEYTVVNQDPELAFQTLSDRAAPEKQECSVLSCLHQFTEVETLTQNNSLLCVTCTKRQPNVDKGTRNLPFKDFFPSPLFDAVLQLKYQSVIGIFSNVLVFLFPIC